MEVLLKKKELDVLFRQDPTKRRNGGFQSFLVKLQDQVNRETGILFLSEKDLEKIPKYAFDYKPGGWENMIMQIFSRTLGSNLGR